MSRFGLIGAASATAVAEEVDEFFENTTLLLHGDGNQGATNFSNEGSPTYLAFKDNSDNNFPITVNGDAYGDNFSPFSVPEGYWSNYFDGSGDNLTLASNAALEFGTGAYTVEFWLNPSALSATSSHVIGSNSTGGFLVYVSNAKIALNNFGIGDVLAYNTPPALNSWTHIAFVREGTGSNQAKLYVNGVAQVTGTDSNNWTVSTNFIIASNASGGQYLTGFLSNIRYIKGTALYTSNFTPSTTPLTAISGTSLLTCQSNRFKDNSSNNFAITRNGDVTVSPFTPFTVTPNTTDGSGYFDGTGDFLTAPSNTAYSFGTGDFTVECWVYSPTNQSNNAIVSNRGGSATDTMWSLEFYGANNRIDWHSGTTIIMSSSSTATLNAWNHIAVSRSGTALRMYLNGVQVASVTDSRNYSAVNALQIGYEPNFVGSSGIGYLTGWVSGLRVLKGTAQYTSNFTPPTTALAAVSGTSLLTCQYQGTVRNVGFIDSSPYDHRITRAGNTTQGSFSPFSKPDGAWGNYFDGSGDYLSFANDSAFAFGTGDFTLEAWVYKTATTADSTVLSNLASSSDGNNALWLYINSNNAVVTSTWFTVLSTSASNVISNNTWNHIAFCRSGTNASVWVNGTRVSNYTLSNNFDRTTGYRVGAYASGSGPYTGHISNARVVKGTAVYNPSSTTITVPTSPLTAISGTSLLTCQSNRFRDNSANNFTITRNGDVKVTPFSPFPITTAYSPAVNGGSGYFDGSGDYLSVPASAQFLPGINTDFTFEAWVYLTATPGAQGAQIVGTGEYGLNSDWSIGVNSSRLPFFYINVPPSGLAVTSSTAINLFSWNHIAVTRSGTSTNNLKMFLNGVNVGQTSTNITLDYNGNNLTLGADENGDEAVLTGYISGLRLINGTGYTSITTPTAPPTAITNTVLLTNFTNAGIFDNTGFNNLETVGNAQIDTSVKKYGTGAMKFDGTGDYLLSPSADTLDFGTADWTLEFWGYRIGSGSASDAPGNVMAYTGSSGGNNAVWLSVDNSGNIRGKVAYNGSSWALEISATTLMATGSWYHIAMTRSGSTVRLFVNGTQEASGSNSTNLSTLGTQVSIGGQFSSSTRYFNGYIDDLRITKGIARYTANFDPPTKAFPNIGE